MGGQHGITRNVNRVTTASVLFFLLLILLISARSTVTVKCSVERHYLPRLSGGYKNTALVSAFMYSEVSCISDPEAGPFQAGFRSERSWVRVRGLEWGGQPD